MTEKNPTQATAGPRLVHDAVSPAAPTPAPPDSPRRRWALRVVVVVGLLGIGAVALTEHRRAAVLEARVAELAVTLADAHTEIAARRQHLEAIRSSVAEMRDRVGALETLASADPMPPPAAPKATPAH